MDLIKSIFGSFLLRGGSSALSFLLTIVIVKKISINEAGYFFLGLAILTAFSQLASFGLQLASLKYISIAVEKTDWPKVKGYIRQTFIWIFLICLFIGLGGFIFRHFISNLIFKKPAMSGVLFYMSPSIIFAGLSFLVSFHLQALNKITMSNFSLSMGTPLFLIIFCYFFKINNAETLSSFFCFSTIITLCLSLLYLIYILPNSRTASIDKSELISCAVPLGVVNMISIALTWSPQFLSGIWVSPEDIAKLAVSLRMANMISLLLLSVNMIVGPKFASLYRQGKLDDLFKTYSSSLRILIVLSLPIGIIVFLFPDFLLSFFGPQYKGASSLLIILSVGQLFHVLSGAVGLLLTMTGHEKDMKNIVLISGIFTLTLAIILIPAIGVTGAAASTTIGITIQNSICIYFVKKRLGISIMKAIFYRNNLLSL